MKEYYGKSAKIYKPRKINKYILIPGIKRAINKPTKNNSKLLDVGCGSGDFFELVQKKGYRYYGFDISKDMIEVAKINYPKGNFSVASTINFRKKIKIKFDVILLSMVLPAIKKKSDITKTLKEVNGALKKGGQVIISIGHPCFNHYMQNYLFSRNDVSTKFNGYFQSETKFKVSQKFDKDNFLFTDYHRTISDYFNLISNAGFKINEIDECEPIKTKDEKINQFLKKYHNFPIYLIFNCTHS